MPDESLSHAVYDVCEIEQQVYNALFPDAVDVCDIYSRKYTSSSGWIIPNTPAVNQTAVYRFWRGSKERGY